MKPIRILAGSLIAVVMCAGLARAQNQSTQSNDGSEAVVQLKLQLVLTEMDGNKKIGSLPYVLRLSASAHRTDTMLRTGVRVPIATSGKDKDIQFQYIDIGTSITSSAKALGDGRYQIHLSVDRSLVYPTSSANQSVPWAPGDPPPSIYPMIGTLREECDLVVRDGQTLQATSASDPVSGHTMLMDVAINLEK